MEDNIEILEKKVRTLTHELECAEEDYHNAEVLMKGALFGIKVEIFNTYGNAGVAANTLVGRIKAILDATLPELPKEVPVEEVSDGS